MNVLVVGGGGREHAIAWKVEQSPLCTKLFVAPGNAGTPGTRVDLLVTDVAGIVSFCQTESVELVIIGPETALAAGLADALSAIGVKAFGPSKAAAQIEVSKSWARAFCERHGILGPRSASFVDRTLAQAWVDAFDGPVVVKADGLAGGKGVIIPDTPAETTAAIGILLASHGRIVIEERLQGEEVSVFGITDGTTVFALPPAQDHKRIFEGDKGPNTGGMGAYAPAPICPPAVTEHIRVEVLQRAIDGLAAEGIPFVGVLFAGIMLTPAGPRVIEFNARFGDPETQAILPLLATDLVELALACCVGRLAETPVRIAAGFAVSVVLAAHRYPDASVVGAPIIDTIESQSHNDVVFHAGTELVNNQIVSSGGRVLSVTGLGTTVTEARANAYARVAFLDFPGKQFRRDIAWRAVARTAGGYAASGVDIDAGHETVDRMKAAVQATYNSAVVAGVGSFGGVLDLAELKRYDHPVLVASNDGVGTKVMVGVAAGNVAGLGADLVNHCINDILVQNARPIAFLDYVAAAKLEPARIAAVVSSMAEACRAVGCVLLGGETAEMPGVYHDGHLDVAGTIIGLADRNALLPRVDIHPGDILIGLGSSGPHTNGYSLLRRVLAGIPLDVVPDGMSVPLGEALLAVHRNYLPVLANVLDNHLGLVKALVHITGGGLLDNPPRILPEGTAARVRLGSWPVPPLFQLVRDASGLDADELHRTLNMGIGMVLVVAAADVAQVRSEIDEDSWIIGDIIEGNRTVTLV